MRFLIDECLTVDLVLVTNNAGDFRKLYAKQPIHAGLIIIIPNVVRAVQRQLFCGILQELATIGDLVNHVLEIGLDGDEIVFFAYPLPA